MKYKYTRKQIADRLDAMWFGHFNKKNTLPGIVSDLLAKEQREFTYECSLCGKEHKESERPCVSKKEQRECKHSLIGKVENGAYKSFLHPKKEDLVSDCCGADFDAFGRTDENGNPAEVCNKCHKTCDVHWGIVGKPKKEQGEELCSHGREKWACLWPHKQPKKEQGEKKPKKIKLVVPTIYKKLLELGLWEVEKQTLSDKCGGVMANKRSMNKSSSASSETDCIQTPTTKVRPDKEQGEKKSKKKCKFCDEPQCGCFGRYCYTHRKNCPKPTPPLKEDRREIKPLDVPSNDLKTWPTNEIMIYHKLCEIIDVINHLSSVEK